MQQKLIIKGRLPGYNDFNTGHWAARYRIKSEAMETIAWSIRAQKIRPVESKAKVRIICYEPNKRRDPSNVRAGAEKVIYDELQNSGIIKDDNWAGLHDIPAQIKLDRENPRVEIFIEGAGQ